MSNAESSTVERSHQSEVGIALLQQTCELYTIPVPRKNTSHHFYARAVILVGPVQRPNPRSLSGLSG